MPEVDSLQHEAALMSNQGVLLETCVISAHPNATARRGKSAVRRRHAIAVTPAMASASAAWNTRWHQRAMKRLGVQGMAEQRLQDDAAEAAQMRAAAQVLTGPGLRAARTAAHRAGNGVRMIGMRLTSCSLAWLA